MNKTQFKFNQAQFSKMFPFFFNLNRELIIESAGTAITKLIPGLEGKEFSSNFVIKRPQIDFLDFTNLIMVQNQLLVMEALNGVISLRYQLEYLEETDTMLFIGSPWFASMEDVIEKKLTLNDFAIHDPLIDLLHILKTQEIANDDLKTLFYRLNAQKDELKRANKEITDTALFPTQNPDPIIRIDPNGNILKKNPAAEKLQQFEYKGNLFSQEAFWKEIVKTLDPKNNRILIEVKGDEEIYSFLIVSLPDHGYYNIYGRIITEQNKLAQELAESANRLSFLITNLNTGVLLEDENRKIVLTNKEFCSIFGIPVEPDFLVGSDCSQAAEQNKHLFINPEEFVNQIHNLLSNRETVLNEILELKDGKFLKRNFIPIWSNGRYVGHLWIYEDVTEVQKFQLDIKASEKRFREVFENSLALIITHDLKGRILSVNPMVSKVFGYDSSELINTSLTDYLINEDKISTTTQYLSNIKVDKERTGVSKFKAKNGNIIYTLFNNFLKEEEGEEPYIIGFGVDISERVLMEEKLIEAKAISEKLTNSKQEFFANMSHEIRTPLNAIIGLSDQLLKTNIDSEQYRYLTTINEASDHLLSIINDLFDISKIEAGKLAIENIGFEPIQLVIKSLKMVTHRAQEKGLSLTNSVLDPRLAQVLIGDPYRINQILFNLLSNAVKYTNKGYVDVRCEVLDEIEGHQKIALIVEDTGIGMNQEFLTRLFDQFSQESRMEIDSIGSTGLGMNITKMLVELLGGQISVKSSINLGTTVTVILNSEIGELRHLPKKFNTKIDNTLLDGKCILVVDDNENNRLVCSIILKNYGAKVVEAEDGQIAIHKMDVEMPDLILMDLQMPKLNGLEATRIIRKLGLKLPIIALTANAVSGEREKCVDAGMNDYLSKPFREAELLQKLALWLNLDLELIQPKTEIIEEEQSEELFNFKKMEEISQGNTEFLTRLAELFCKNIPNVLDQMNTAVKDQDIKTISSLAHKIKPNINDLNINSIYPIVKQLEAFGHQDEIDYSIVGQMVNNVSIVLKEVIDKIKSDFKLI
jgi:PAS domain S-box-containing protein